MKADDRTLPCRGGDWLMNKHNHRVAQVKSVYRDSLDGGVLVDLYLYDWDGNKTGRESAIEGGPRTFEPACDYDNWHRIKEPAFPMSPKWIEEDGKRIGRYWAEPRPDGAYKKRKPRGYGVARISQNASEHDVRHAWRIAAEELREIVRDKGLTGSAKDAVLARAAELEEKANEGH